MGAIPRDDDGTHAARIKKLEEQLSALSRRDVTLVDDNGGILLAAADAVGDGLTRPRLAATVTTPGMATAVTATTWVEAFTVAGRRQNATWEIRFTATATGTDGQVQAVLVADGTVLQAPVTVTTGTTFTAVWIIDLPGALDDYLEVQIQAQRLTGAGTVTVRPYGSQGG